MTFLRLALVLILFTVVASCSRNNVEVTPTDTITVAATDVSVSLLDQDAVEFYKDVAVLAEWYADHPTTLKAELAKNASHTYTDSTYNDFLAEFSAMEMYDENGKAVSFFDLDETTRHSFLKDYVKLEASFLDSKWKYEGTEQADDQVQLLNAAFDQVVKTSAFTETIDFNAEAARIKSNNPYEDVEAIMIRNDGNPTIRLQTSQSAEQNFYKFLADSKILANSVVTFNSLCFSNTPQNFVDKLRNDLQKGRVLVSLPGGYVTNTPLVLNATTSKAVYDVGHVAIISVDKAQVPSKVDENTSISIGTNSDKGMHNESLGPDWTSKHGISYLMQPIRVSYKYKSKFGLLPWWERSQTDVDNSKTYQKIASVMGTPYCSALEFLHTKWVAPSRFICSSSAWWAIKEAHDIGIGNFYKPTIFPAGVYESSDMRVVAKSY